MTKTEHVYIDSKHTILRTPNNLVEQSIAGLEAAAKLRQAGKKAVAEKAEPTLVSFCKEALAFGEVSAAYLLAYFSYNGYGTKKSVEITKLWLSIGASLGDLACSALVNEGRDDGKLMMNFLATKPTYSSKLKEHAQLYANAISQVAKSHGLDEEITYDQRFEAREIVDHVDPAHTIELLGLKLVDDAHCGGCIIV